MWASQKEKVKEVNQVIGTKNPGEIYTDTIKNILCNCKQYIELHSLFFLHVIMQIEKKLSSKMLTIMHITDELEIVCSIFF